MDKHKTDLYKFRLAYDKNVRLVDEAKSKYEKQLQSYKNQVAELQNLLKLASQQKDDNVKAARDKEKNWPMKPLTSLSLNIKIL